MTAITDRASSRVGKVAVVTPKRAREMLLEPQAWPADLVQLAADQLTETAARKVPVLLEVAIRDKWFQIY